MQDTYSTRTALSYVTEKIRQHDHSGSINTISLNEQEALVLTDTIQDSTYFTYIYADEDALYELTIPDDREPDFNMGEQIIEVKNFCMQDLGNGFYEFSAADQNGDTVSLLLHLRSD